MRLPLIYVTGIFNQNDWRPAGAVHDMTWKRSSLHLTQEPWLASSLCSCTIQRGFLTCLHLDAFVSPWNVVKKPALSMPWEFFSPTAIQWKGCYFVQREFVMPVWFRQARGPPARASWLFFSNFRPFVPGRYGAECIGQLSLEYSSR